MSNTLYKLEWPVEPLVQHTAVLETGSRPRGGVSNYMGGIPSISAEQISENGMFKWDNIKYVPEHFFKKAKKGIIKEGDILIIKDGATTGKCAFVDSDFPFKKAMINEHTYLLRTKHGLLSKYVCYFLKSHYCKEYFEYRRKLGVIGGLNKNFICDIKLPVPPLDEQRRIVARIEELTRRAEEARRLRQEAIKEITNLVQIELKRIFSSREMDDWIEYQGKQVFDIVRGQVDPRKKPYIDFPHVAPNSIESGTGNLQKNQVKTPRELRLKSGKYHFNSSHVLYSKIRPNLRKVVLPDFEGTCSADMYPLIPNTDIVTRDFLALTLLAPPFTQYAIENSDRNAMPKINRPTMLGYRMKLPSIEVQREIVSKVKQIQTKADKITALQNKAALEMELFQSALLAKAFRGKL